MIAQMSEACVEIRENITTLDAFCEWAQSPEYPRYGRFSFLRGELWMDPEMELLLLHNLLKLEISACLHAAARTEKRGYVFTDRAFLRNDLAGLATEPDAMFVSFRAIDAGQAELTAGKGEGLMVVDGAPDMVLEVVSSSSVRKDTIELRDLYWQAGIPEYWLVDARHEPVRFDILKHGANRYVPTRKIGGWLKSSVFERSFRLTAKNDQLGNPEFTLIEKRVSSRD